MNLLNLATFKPILHLVRTHLVPFFHSRMYGPRSLTLQGRASVPPTSVLKVAPSDKICGCVWPDCGVGRGKLYGWPETRGRKLCIRGSMQLRTTHFLSLFIPPPAPPSCASFARSLALYPPLFPPQAVFLPTASQSRSLSLSLSRGTQSLYLPNRRPLV